MVDTGKYTEASFISADFVMTVSNRNGIIIQDGVEKEGDYGPQLEFMVELGGKIKPWRPNKTHLKALQTAWGMDSAAWLGKPILFVVVEKKLVVNPIMDHVVSLMQKKD